MRVLLANKFFFRNGGSEAVMFQEREFLSQSGHMVAEFSMDDARNVASDYADHFVGRKEYRTGTTGSNRLGTALGLIHSPEAVKKFSRLIRQFQPDLVHCHNIYHQLTPSIVGAAKKLGVPVVLTLHDYKPVCPVYTRLRDGQACSDCLGGNFINVMKHRCAGGSLGKSALLFAEASVQRWMGSYEVVDAFIAPSRFMKHSVERRFSEERVKLLYNGVDVSTTSASNEDDGYVLYFGRLSAEKGIETLLKAHASSDSRWPLRVAGSGPMEDALRKQYPGVEFLGHVSGKALVDVVSRASVIVVPSEWYENCPMSVLEAMAYGKPVVGARMGGIPELVTDGETGLLFDAGNAAELKEQLNKLMSDTPFRARMGAAARDKAAREFSLAKHNEGLIDIYRSVCGK